MRRVCLTVIFSLLLTATLILPSAVSQELPEYESLLKGMDYFKEGNYEKALDEFLKASVILPYDLDIPLYIGLTYLNLKDNQKAITFFKKAVEMNPENLDAQFQLGTALIQQGAYEEAIRHLEIVWEKEPQREDLGYLLGFAHYQLALYQKALDYLKAGKTTDKAIQSLTLYYTGLSEQQLGLTKEAQLTFREVVTFDPTSPMAPLAKRFIETLEIELKKKKRLSIEFNARPGYDDNVLLVPDDNVFGLREAGHDSYFQTLSLKTSFLAFTRPNWEVSASYGVNQVIYDSIRDLDSQDHVLSLDGVYRGRLGPTTWEIRPNYTFDWFLVNYDWFLTRNSFRLPYLLNETSRNTSVLEYDLHLMDFKARPSAAEAASDRDAMAHDLGLNHFFHTVDWKHYIKAGYLRTWQGAEGDNWNYWSNRLVLGFQYTLPLDLKLRTDIAWEKLNYEDTDTFFSKRREDTDRLFYTSLSKEITDYLSLFFDYTRRRNTSNIRMFDFEKNVFSFGVTFRY